jgi:hypothetical protein
MAPCAVICTDGTSIDKSFLADVPDMKGLELASKFHKEPYFYGDGTHRIGFRFWYQEIFFAILLKEIAI